MNEQIPILWICPYCEQLNEWSERMICSSCKKELYPDIGLPETLEECFCVRREGISPCFLRRLPTPNPEWLRRTKMLGQIARELHTTLPRVMQHYKVLNAEGHNFDELLARIPNLIREEH